MKFFNRWLLKKLKYCWENADEIEYGINHNQIHMPVGTGNISDVSLRTQGIRFTMYKASGGMVIETESYNEKTDRRTTGLYVCTNTDTLGEELSKILTLETLKS